MPPASHITTTAPPDTRRTGGYPPRPYAGPDTPLSAFPIIPWPAPSGIVLTDLDWIADISHRYGLPDLTIPAGSVVLERISAAGGRCFCYPDGSWLIGLSEPRLQRCGRRGVEGIIAHELLHAWLWQRHRYRGHGPIFEDYAAARGIPRWCSAYQEVRQLGPQQLALFDTWPPAPLTGL